MPTTTGFATDFITFSRAANATVTDSDGKVKWAPHNLVLNSATPATQSLTVIVGAQYTVAITGAGSVALSGAGTGTATAGSPATVTATTTTLTLTVTAPVTTMWAYRSDLGGMQLNASGSTYNATTSAAYYGPRRDFDPVTLACKGLLVEEQRTNLVLRSAEFNVTWGNVAGVVNVSADATTAPDGTSSADKLVPAAATDYMLKRQSVTTTSVSHTYSIYGRQSDSGYYLELFTTTVSNVGAVFDLSTGSVLGSANCTTVVSSPDANGWRRYSITFTATASTTYVDVRVTTSSTINQSMTGDGTKGIFVWGAQLEAGSFATSYIPTGSATATRSADVASVSTQAFPYSSTEGTLVVNGNALSSSISVNSGVDLYSDGGNKITIRGPAMLAIVGGSTVANFYVGAINTSPNKRAIAYKASDFGAAYNGTAATPVTSGSVPSAAVSLNFNVDANTFSYNGYIRQITYIPRRLSNAELQQRTSA